MEMNAVEEGNTKISDLTPVAKSGVEIIESKTSQLDNAAEKYKADECSHFAIRSQELSEVNIVDGSESSSDVSLQVNKDDKTAEAVDPIAKEKELRTYIRKKKRGPANPLV